MLRHEDAIELSHMLTEPGMFPEAKEGITRTLLDYYKAILTAAKREPIPTVRRMW
jgi:hypothetical protein